MKYDTAEKLDECKFTNEGYIFTHWSTLGLGSRYSDEASVVNLCSLEENGDPQGYELTANWILAEHTTMVITRDGEPVEGLEDNITLKAATEDIRLTGSLR